MPSKVELTQADYDALMTVQRGYGALIALGCRDPIMAPRDGTPFKVVCFGSVGVYKCRVSPEGSFNVEDGGQTYPQRGRGGLLWKPL